MRAAKAIQWVILAGAAIVVILIVVLMTFSDAIINKYLRTWAVSTLSSDYPQYRFAIGRLRVNIWRNFAGADGVRVNAVDSSVALSVARISADGILWRLLFSNKKSDPTLLDRLRADIQEISLSFPKSFYRLSCRRLRLSAADSSISGDTLTLATTLSDDRYFATTRFKTTRYELNAPRLKLTGANFDAAFNDSRIEIRSINVDRLFFDGLASTFKPKNLAETPPGMPIQALTSLPVKLRIGAVNLVDAKLQYRELYSQAGPPATIHFDHSNIALQNITSDPRPGEVATVDMNGGFMESGRLHAFLSFPLETRELSFRFSGAIDSLDVRNINSFLSISEQIRVDSGFVQSSKFETVVEAGHANGQIFMTYKDLRVSILSSREWQQQLTSWIVNIKIRNENTPPPRGNGKVGLIQWTKIPCETFFAFLWRSLRSGIGDVVGFKVKQTC